MTHAMRRPPHDIHGYGFNGALSYEIKAGTSKTERVVPPAGDEYAFDITTWQNEVEVYISPTGRSVRVFKNGRELK